MALSPPMRQRSSRQGDPRHHGGRRFTTVRRVCVLMASTGVAALCIVGTAPAASALDGGITCSNPATITTCVMNMLTPPGGEQGVFLKQVGGAVLATDNATVPYEPASSIKPVIALYAMKKVQQGSLKLTSLVPEINPFGGPGDCPPGTFVGSEQLGSAIEAMLENSDNNRTEELMEFFGVANLNAFAASLGLSGTMFQTAVGSPGFNVIGCLSYGFSPLPSTVDGNTMTLADITTLWQDIAALPAPYADTLYELAAGRDMANLQGSDGTGTWPIMQTLVSELAPASMSAAQVLSFMDHMTVAIKGGDYFVADCSGPGCEATWWVNAGVIKVPTCVGHSVVEKTYIWGFNESDVVGPSASNPDQTPGGVADINAKGELFGAPIAQALAGWKACAPTGKVKLHVAKAKLSSGITVGVGTTLTTVTDSDKADIAPDLNAKISWGDGGFPTLAVLSGGNGAFTVHGWHQYKHAGKFNATVTVTSLQNNRSAKKTIKVTVS